MNEKAKFLGNCTLFCAIKHDEYFHGNTCVIGQTFSKGNLWKGGISIVIKFNILFE